ncbi:MAG: hypothetical protein IPN07_13690 [Dehalococcoidia bacterium]|nr:hypothetical protein [Dehalococcoidia bacterium]
MVLLVGEASVAIRFSGQTGLFLMAATAGLSAFAYRGIQALDASGQRRPRHGERDR